MRWLDPTYFKIVRYLSTKITLTYASSGNFLTVWLGHHSSFGYHCRYIIPVGTPLSGALKTRELENLQLSPFISKTVRDKFISAHCYYGTIIGIYTIHLCRLRLPRVTLKGGARWVKLFMEDLRNYAPTV